MGFSTAFDVWVQSTNTVYSGVPFGVVTDWAQQGRISKDDKVRSAGTQEAWVLASEHDIIADYLFVKQETTAIPGKSTEALEPVEMDVGWKRQHDDDDVDPDMIPLIDISLVLLIFFMMTASVAVTSPLPLPQMKNVADLKGDPEALMIKIDKLPNGEILYSMSVGDKPPDPSAVELQTLTGIVGVLDAKLNEMLSRDPRKPEVHIACHEEIPCERVHDLANELEKRKKDGKIAFYGALVSEVPK